VCFWYEENYEDMKKLQEEPLGEDAALAGRTT
jgi:hypothetical protein